MSHVGTGPLSAQEVAPAHWVADAYATAITLQKRLNTDALGLVTRPHTCLTERTQTCAPPPAAVQVWITLDGTVERTAFDTLRDLHTDADLRAILATKRLQGPPPADMRSR